MLANIYNGTETEYALGKSIQFDSWNPNGVHFAFKVDDSMMQLGHICQEPQPLMDANEILWLDDKTYLTVSGLGEEQRRQNEIWGTQVYSITHDN